MRHALAAALLLLAAPASAATIVIDFEAEPDGLFEPSYTHPSGLVTFTAREVIEVRSFGTQGDGRSLGAGDDDSGYGLELSFSTPLSAVSLDFGNDDPAELDTTDGAWLQAFLGGVMVGEVGVAVNANDVMDQTITLSGVGPFDRAVFTYTGNIDEVIDNLVLTTVPEPGTLGLGALALALLASSRSRTGGCSSIR